ncbi:MAG: hypothetical protein ACYDA4_09075 [Ignavibacteriaceae bacterium]
MYSSTINYHPLLDALKKIQSVQLKTKKKRQDYFLELYFKPNKLEVSTIGISITVECKSSYYKKLIVPFLSFQQLTHNINKEWIHIEFDDGYVVYDNRKIESNLIKVEHPENHRKPSMSINYSKIELLSLRNRYSESELKMNNILNDLRSAESELAKNISMSVTVLNPYGITYDEIKDLINKKINAILNVNRN